jgi:hypothetical protein
MDTGTLWGLVAILVASGVATVFVWCAAVLAKRADASHNQYEADGGATGRRLPPSLNDTSS